MDIKNNIVQSVPIEGAIEKRKIVKMDIYDMAKVFFAE
jgi:hypothetical protein